MKYILFVLLLWSGVAGAQSGYTIANHRYRYLALGADGLNIPAGTTPALATMQWRRAGALYYDSTGGNVGLHVWTGSTWIRVMDTLQMKRFGVSGEDFEAVSDRNFDLNSNSMFITDGTEFGVTVTDQAFLSSTTGVVSASVYATRDWSGLNAASNDTVSYLQVYPDSVDVSLGTGAKFRVHNLPQGVGTRALRYNPTTQEVSYADTTTGGSGTLSSLTAATGTNDIQNASYRQRWRWETLAGDTALVINSTNTTAASSAQVGAAFMLKGANANSGQGTETVYISNTKTGTTSANVGLKVRASGGINNYGIRSIGDNATANYIGLVLTNESGNQNGSSASIDWNVFNTFPFRTGNITNRRNTINDWSMDIGTYGEDSVIRVRGTGSGSGARVGIRTYVPTASLHLPAGTTAASGASLKITEGARTTTAEDGAIEKDDAFYLTKTNAVRYGVGGTLTSIYTTVGNVGTGEDNLHSYSIPAGTLSQDGDWIEFEMAFSSPVSGGDIKVYYGSVQLGNATANSNPLVVKGRIVRTSATSQRISFEYLTNAVQSGYLTGTETLSGAVTLRATAEATSNNDITQVLTTVKFFPAN